MEMKYLKYATRLLNRDCVNTRGLDLSKEVLWVSVSQRTAAWPTNILLALEHGTVFNMDFVLLKSSPFNSVYLLRGRFVLLLIVYQ